ncbi:hypothetical protein HHI36_014669 [Cryptolaemus montrouzieri]|uniref:Paired domain-containing protein n=1 Tax=Cryptolaemus montrouzieri TaxID=559131 RepID=A0ABD2N3F5_9CUCU
MRGKESYLCSNTCFHMISNTSETRISLFDNEYSFNFSSVFKRNECKFSVFLVDFRIFEFIVMAAERHGRYLSDHEVVRIVTFLEEGRSQCYAVNLLNVKQSNISRAINRYHETGIWKKGRTGKKSDNNTS